MQIQKNYALSQRNKLKSLKINAIRTKINQNKIALTIKKIITTKNIRTKINRNERAINQKSIRVNSLTLVKKNKIK